MAEGDLSVLVLIGMRGCGKTANGIAAAQALGRKFVDLDDVFEEEVGETINEFVDKYDWPAMREKEADILGRALTNQPLAGQRYGPHDPVVVACGGGVIETEANVAALTAFYGVIFVDRNIDDIVDYLEGAGSYRPGLGDHPATIFERRLPLYKQCCDYQFTIAKGETDFDAVNSDFERLYLPPPRPPPAPPLSASTAPWHSPPTPLQDGVHCWAVRPGSVRLSPRCTRSRRVACSPGAWCLVRSVLADAPVLCLTHPGYAEWADGATRSALAAMSPEAVSAHGLAVFAKPPVAPWLR